MARDSPPTCARSSVEADSQTPGHELSVGGRRRQDRCKLFSLAITRVLRVVLSAFNDAIVLLFLATMYTDSVAALALAAAASQAVLHGCPLRLLQTPREVSYEARALLQASCASWGALIALNAALFLGAGLLLHQQTSLTLSHADPAMYVLMIIATVDSLHGLWVTSCYHYFARRLLAASSDHSILRWALNLTRRTSCTFFHPTTVLALPAAASAWSIVPFVVSLILAASPLSLTNIFSASDDVRLGEYQSTVLVVLSAYAVLSTIYYAAAVRIFVSLGADEDNVGTDIVLECDAPLDGRVVAEPVRLVAEPR